MASVKMTGVLPLHRNVRHGCLYYYGQRLQHLREGRARRNLHAVPVAPSPPFSAESYDHRVYVHVTDGPAVSFQLVCTEEWVAAGNDRSLYLGYFHCCKFPA